MSARRHIQPPLLTTVTPIPYDHMTESNDLLVTLGAAGLEATRSQVDALLAAGVRGAGCWTTSTHPADLNRADENAWRIINAVKKGNQGTNDHHTKPHAMP